MTTHLAMGAELDSLDVLVAEDMRPMQALMRSMLFSCGVARVRVAESADQALQLMLAEPPHLVVAEFRMLPRSGYELLQTLRRKAMAPLCFVPLIMVAAQATRSMVERSYRAGAHAFLAKPFSPSALRRALDRVLSDERPFRLEGDSYVIEGVEERLDALAEEERALRRARRYHAATRGAADDDGDAGIVTMFPRSRRSGGRPNEYGAVADADT